MEFHYEHQGKQYPVKISRHGETFDVEVGDRVFHVESKEVKPGFFAMNISGRPVKCNIAIEGNQRQKQRGQGRW